MLDPFSSFLLTLAVVALAAVSASGCGPSGDPCESNVSPTETLGCNGGFDTSVPPPNAPAGPCTAGPTARGSCGTDAVCQEVCLPLCTATAEVSTGGCPVGFRCHAVTDPDVCLRDCDDTHPCPTGTDCNAGRCIPAIF